MDEQYFDVFKTWFIGNHNTDLPGARFNIGQMVLYRGVEQVVLAVNCVEDETYEYVLDVDWPLAVWEDELEVADEVQGV